MAMSGTEVVLLQHREAASLNPAAAKHCQDTSRRGLLTVFSPGSRSPSGHYTSCRGPARCHVAPHVIRDNTSDDQSIMKPMAGGRG